MLSVRSLECTRGARRLFTDLSFDLVSHQLLEVRGANGSGKTTLLRALCGLCAPTAGRVTWKDVDIRALGEEYRACIAYLGHLHGITDDLTPLENTRYAARLAGSPVGDAEALAALQAFGMDACRELPCRALSQGQRRRVALARLQLSRGHPLWILDEPFSGLDAAAVLQAEGLLESHLAQGGMVVLTTHAEVPLRGGHAKSRIELGTPASEAQPQAGYAIPAPEPGLAS